MVADKYKEAIKAGITVQWEEISSYPAGIKTGEVSVTPIYNSEGVCIQLVGSVHDITERKQIEESIKVSEKKYKALIEQASDPIMITDEQGNFTDVNSSFCELFGYSKPELLSMNIRSLIDTEQIKQEPMRFDELLEGKHVFSQWRMVHKNGSIIDVEANVKMIPDGRILAIARNITERKKAELELRMSEETRRLIMNSSLDAIICIDTKGSITMWTPRAEEIFGWKEIEVIGKRLADLIIPVHYREQHWKGLNKYLETKEANVLNKLIEISALNHKGEEFPIELTIVPYEQNGELFFCGFLRDITQRRKAESEVQKFNERFEMIASTTHDAIWEWNLQTNELWANEMHQRLYGLNVSDPVPLIDEWKQRIHPADRDKTVKGQDEALASEKNAWISEYRFQTDSGEYRDIYDRTYIVRNEKGDPVRLMGSMMDITERKIVERELLRLNERYFTLMNNVDGIVWEADAKTFEFSFVSKQAERLLGYPVGQWIKEPDFWRNHIYIDDREWAVNYCLKHTLEKKSHEFEYRMVAADGRNIWLRDIVSIQVRNGEAVRLSGIMVDISERKKTEQQFAREKEFSDSIINSLPGVFYLYDENGKFLRWNKNFEIITGYSKNEIDRLHPLDLFEGEEKEIVSKKIKEVFDKGMAEVEAYFWTKDKKTIPYYFNGWRVIFEGRPCLIGVGIDITERKKAETEILLANERFNLIAKATNDFVWDAYLNESKVWWNDNYYSQLGWKKGVEIPGGDSWENHIHPDDKKRVTDGITQMLTNTDKTIWTDEYRFGKADGSYITVYDRGYIIRDKTGKAHRIIGAMTDISAIKEAEKELRNSEEKYRLLFKNNPMPMWVLSLKDFSFLAVNEAALDHYGYSEDEFLKLTALDIRPEEEKKRFLAGADKSIGSLYNAGIWKHKKKDNSVIDVEIFAYPMTYEGKLAELILVNDITERRKAEDLLKKSFEDIRRLASHLEQIREEERMHIAREIHDELGQQLTVLKMDIAWLNKKLENKEPQIQGKITDLISVVDNTVKTVRRISTELRPSILDDLGLHAALEWQCQEFEKRSGIKTYLASQAEHLKMPSDIATGLFRIFQESLTNVARHADATKVHAQLKIDNGNLVLIINDNGKGFLSAGIENKKTLGILGMRERVSLMGGEFKILSTPGSGTEIWVSVPVSNST
jgi:PAS domain S-box-containing protein